MPVFCAIDTLGIEEFAKTNSFALFEIDFANCDISENRFFRESKIGKPYPFLPIVIIYREGRFHKYFPVQMDSDVVTSLKEAENVPGGNG